MNKEDEVIDKLEILIMETKESAFPTYWSKENAELVQDLLTFYKKEIEKNKDIKNKLEEKNIPIETFIAEWERLEDLEDDLTTSYMNGFYDGEKKWKNKIKEKIRYYQELYKQDNSPNEFLIGQDCLSKLSFSEELLKENN